MKTVYRDLRPGEDFRAPPAACFPAALVVATLRPAGSFALAAAPGLLSAGFHVLAAVPALLAAGLLVCTDCFVRDLPAGRSGGSGTAAA